MAADRQPRGIPAGGQFAATAHNESSISLIAPSVEPRYVGNRLEDQGLVAYFNLDQLNEVAARLNDSKDFSDRNIHDIADQIHLQAHGYTASQARDADLALQTLRNAGHPDQAEALLAVTEARLANARRAARGQSAPAQDAAPVVPDVKNVPVPAEDPRVQAGHVFDKVEVDGQTYHRRRDGVLPNTPYGMRLQFNRPLSESEKRHLAGLTGYAYRSSISGEPLGEPYADSPYSFVVSSDMTKSSRDDLGVALEEFEDKLPAMIQEGSPVRVSDRSGPGTRGTRLVEGFNEPDLTFEIFYDDVIGDS